MKRINWADHLISFVVVILGIYIAFKLNSYSESAATQKMLNDHMKYVRDETILNRYNLEQRIESCDTLILQIDQLLDLLANDGDLRQIHRLTSSIVNYQYVYLKKNAYLTLTESGDIRYIKNYQLKTNTIRIYEYYAWTKLIEENAGDVLTNEYFPYVRKNMNLLTDEVQPRSVYFDKEFINTIVSYKYAVAFLQQKYNDCLAEMNNYLELLEENGIKEKDK